LPSGTVGTVLFDIGDVFLASMIYLEGGPVWLKSRSSKVPIEVTS
jgi:hypothetical protein